MPQEEKYPTLKMWRCKQCNSIFLDNFAGNGECPECGQAVRTPYQPATGEGRDISGGAQAR